MKGFKVKPLAVAGTRRKGEKHSVVKSLADVKALIRRVGEKEKVKVVVGDTIKQLCDVKPMRKLLRRKIREKNWFVDVTKLEPFLGIATLVHHGQEAVVKLIRLVDPSTDLAAHNISPANRKQLIGEAARRLRKAGRRLESTKYPPTVYLGKDIIGIGKKVKTKYRKDPG